MASKTPARAASTPSSRSSPSMPDAKMPPQAVQQTECSLKNQQHAALLQTGHMGGKRTTGAEYILELPLRAQLVPIGTAPPAGLPGHGRGGQCSSASKGGLCGGARPKRHLDSYRKTQPYGRFGIYSGVR
jgi:hypothetical protein